MFWKWEAGQEEKRKRIEAPHMRFLVRFIGINWRDRTAKWGSTARDNMVKRVVKC
jgi:hypothetical protein